MALVKSLVTLPCVIIGSKDLSKVIRMNMVDMTHPIPHMLLLRAPVTPPPHTHTLPLLNKHRTTIPILLDTADWSKGGYHTKLANKNISPGNLESGSSIC